MRTNCVKAEIISVKSVETAGLWAITSLCTRSGVDFSAVGCDSFLPGKTHVSKRITLCVPGKEKTLFNPRLRSTDGDFEVGNESEDVAAVC